jgi:hypothetical protein
MLDPTGASGLLDLFYSKKRDIQVYCEFLDRYGDLMRLVIIAGSLTTFPSRAMVVGDWPLDGVDGSDG